MAKAEKIKANKFEDLSWPPGLLSGKVGISQSLLTMAMQCDRQVKFALNRWEKPGKEVNTFFGTCCHELMDIFYTAREIPDESMLSAALDEFLAKEQEKGKLDWLLPSDRAYQETIITTIMSEYFVLYKDDFDFTFYELENVFNVPYNGITLTGKKDGIIGYNDKKWLFEHKTKGKINEEQIITNLDINFQTQFYMLAHRVATGEPLDGVLYNIIRRTTTKPKANEKLKSYADRLRKDIQSDYSYFFKRYECEYSQEQVMEFESELIEKIERLVALFKGKRRALKNEAFCIGTFECPYLTACATKSLDHYRQRSVISPELE